MEWTTFGQSFVTLLVILDPLGSIPVFLSLTRTYQAKGRHRAAYVAVLVATGVLAGFAAFGAALIRYLSIFTDIDAAELAIRPEGGGAEVAAPSAHGMENILIEELELGVRSYNCLKRVGIETIGDLIGKSEAELAAIPNFGKKSIEEVRETLATHGLTLRGENGSGALGQ